MFKTPHICVSCSTPLIDVYSHELLTGVHSCEDCYKKGRSDLRRLKRFEVVTTLILIDYDSTNGYHILASTDASISFNLMGILDILKKNNFPDNYLYRFSFIVENETYKIVDMLYYESLLLEWETVKHQIRNIHLAMSNIQASEILRERHKLS